MEFDLLEILAEFTRDIQKFYCQRFNVNVIGLICSSFYWKNDYSLMYSYHPMDGNWQGTLVE